MIPDKRTDTAVLKFVLLAQVSNFAKRVSGFAATQGGAPLAWDKTDPDSWQIRPAGRGTVTITFDFLADELDNAMAWSQADFLMVNGTNVFLYPEGRSLDFPSTVTVATEAGWRVATGMAPGGSPRSYRAGNYHDLVDMPFFIGRFDFDSTLVQGKWVRLASYPEGALSGAARMEFWSDLEKYLPVEIAVFGVAPYDSYTNLLIFDQDFGGGSDLQPETPRIPPKTGGFPASLEMQTYAYRLRLRAEYGPIRNLVIKAYKDEFESETAKIPGRVKVDAFGRYGDTYQKLTVRITLERVQLRDLVVIKRSGRRTPFDRDKLARSLMIALRKRPIEQDQIEQMISGIVRKLESQGENEVPSETIGEMVMEALARLDPVAYVRYASVYRDFRETSDFADFIEEAGKAKPGGRSSE